MKKYHIIAVIVVLIWGTTFVNTKVLIQHGLTPSEIFIIRALIAYICLWAISPRKLFAEKRSDEWIFLILGITGGSLYFNTENLAVQYTLVNNVSFIVCTAPLCTALLAIIFTKAKATASLIVGSAIAVIGMGLVIFNGHFILKINSMGDFMALSAAICWGIYGFLMRKPTDRYGAVFVTRKVFFYGLLTGIPFLFIGHAPNLSWALLSQPVVYLNIIYLSIISSFICFVLWSLAIKKIGAIKTANYVYLNPISTILASFLVLNESITILAFLGCIMILSGVFVANRK